jgi:putative membrane protein
MQKFSTTRLAGVLAIGALAIACSPKAEDGTDTLATTPPATATTPTTDMGWTDANVIDVITVANQGEVDYSQLGVDKATNASVKEFAQMMVKDHGTMLTAVKDLAARLNVTPASNDKANELKEDVNKEIGELNAKTVGKDFDNEFMEEQVELHQKTLDLLNDLDGRTTNADLKAAIAEAKPKVQAHLDRAKAVKDLVD